MFVVEVIPLTMLPPNVPQILSYFFDLELQRGTVVEISLNNRKIKAVVVSSNSIEKEKLALKKVDFQIKKIVRVLYEKPQVSNYQLKLAVWLAKYYYAPLGYTLKTILPSFAFKKKFPLTAINQTTQTKTSGVVKPQFLIYKTRGLVKHLESAIKKTIANSKQILIVVPEKNDINYFTKNLSDKFKTSVVFSGLPNKELYDIWRKTQSGETEIVIGTRQALNMNFKDLGLVIVDDPLHEFYKSDMMPRYNAVALAHKIAELNNSQLILTSVVTGVENYYKIKNGVYELKEIEPRPKFETEIIDMAQEIKSANWLSISKKLSEELIARLRENKRVLMFSPRRGYAGILICGNCGSAVKCPRCDVAMRTHRSVEVILTCHHCEISRPVPRNCPVCGSSNLKPVGPAGTQKIYEIIKSKLIASNIKSPVLVLDSDVVKNETEEEELVSEIIKSKSSVLIATQMIFSHRFYLNFDLISIINADAFMNIPDFRSEENLIYQIEKLVNFLPVDKRLDVSFIHRQTDRSKTGKMLIQTYNPENKIIEKAVKGDYEDFYENELKSREAMNYPPFYKLIKLTFRHKDKNKASYAARITTEKLKMAIARSRLGEEIKIIEATPAYIEREKGLYIYNIFLKVKEGYQDINELLKYVGPGPVPYEVAVRAVPKGLATPSRAQPRSGWIIDVEPRSLL